MHTLNSRSGIQRAIQLLGIVGKLAIGVLLLGVVVKSNVPAANAGPSLAPQAASAVVLPSQIFVPPSGFGVATTAIFNDATPNGLAAAEFEMTYNTSVANAISAADAGFLYSTGRQNPNSVGITMPLKSLDNTAGLAAVGLFSLSTNPAQGTPNGPNGTGALAKVGLKAVGAAGTSTALNLQNVMTTDALANPTNINTTTGAQFIVSNQPALILPALMKNYAPPGITQGSLSTAAQIQNLDSASAMNTTLTYMDTPGGNPFASVTINVPAQNMSGVDQRTDNNLGSTFTGSGIFASDKLGAALVNIQSAGTESTFGQNFRLASYSVNPGATDAGTTLNLPQVLKAIHDNSTNKDFTSLIVLQNTTAVSTTATITFFPVGGPSSNTNVPVPAWSSAYVWMGNVSGVGSTFFGSARITASQPIVALVEQNANGALLGYKAFASGATTLFAPQILKGIFDAGQGYTFGTAIAVMALSGSPNVTIVCKPAGGGSTITETLQANPFASFDQRSDPNFGGTFFGSCTITSSADPIVAIVNLQTDFVANKGVRIMTYPALASTEASTNVFAPQLLKDVTDGSTGITFSSAMTVQAIGASANITVTYQGSTSLVRTATCTPQCNVDQRFDAGLISPYFGSAKITSSSPILIKVNFTGSGAARGDSADNYIAIKQ